MYGAEGQIDPVLPQIGLMYLGCVKEKEVSGFTAFILVIWN